MFAGTSDQLIENITASRLFSGAPKLCRLLEYFYENKDRRVAPEELEHDHYGRLKGTAEHDPGHARLTANELKNKLVQYAQHAPQEEWLRCELLPSARGEGYKLSFYASSATAFFWSPHLGSGKEITVVCDPLLFFYDHANGTMLRFVDTNIDKSDRKQALDELERLHPGVNADNDLVPGHFYLNAGAIMAAESLRDYFWNHAKRRVPLILTKDGLKKQLLSSSPIMVGTIRTNTVMKEIFSSPVAKGIAYRMSAGKFPWVTVAKPTQREQDALVKPLGMKIDRDGNGVLEMRGNGRIDSLTSEATLGIVTRLANPLGTGAITLISSYSILNVAKIATALTDETRMKGFFTQMDWPLEPQLPESFEMMFRVNLAPANMDDEATDAKLLCWRPR